MAEETTMANFETEDTQKDKYLTFHLAGENYGIEIQYVIEIIGIQNITEVPDMPVFIRGVINLRGKVVPIMDVRARFGIEARDYDDRTCIIVVNIDNTEVGLVVDEVSEVMDIPEKNVEPAPKTHKNNEDSYIQGMGKMNADVKILLDIHKLLFSGEMQALTESLEDQ
ncbi:MAG: chemotaxis protein CheW [Thermodesulfobacteriota bacterium]|nr:chemotaxis protein CheW [Thermodesulfobacteriota bacterium]